MDSLKNARAGRPRLVVPRQPNGQPRRVADPAPVALAKRLAAVGVDAGAMAPRDAARLGRDPATGTVLGRLTWEIAPDGQRVRRLGADGLPLITDAMLIGADTFRSAWAAWSRAEGLPARTAGAVLPMPSSGRSLPPDDAQAAEAVRRWRCLCAAVMACDNARMVWAALDAVVIDDCPWRLWRLDDLRAGLLAVASSA